MTMQLTVRPSTRCAEYLRLCVCGDWEELGMRGRDKVVLRHRPTGQTVTYATHDGGNEWNGPRNMATRMQRICGCTLIRPRSRHRSRRRIVGSGFDMDAAIAEARTREAADEARFAAAQRRREAEWARQREEANWGDLERMMREVPGA